MRHLRFVLLFPSLSIGDDDRRRSLLQLQKRRDKIGGRLLLRRRDTWRDKIGGRLLLRRRRVEEH